MCEGTQIADTRQHFFVEEFKLDQANVATVTFAWMFDTSEEALTTVTDQIRVHPNHLYRAFTALI